MLPWPLRYQGPIRVAQLPPQLDADIPYSANAKTDAKSLRVRSSTDRNQHELCRVYLSTLRTLNLAEKLVRQNSWHDAYHLASPRTGWTVRRCQLLQMGSLISESRVVACQNDLQNAGIAPIRGLSKLRHASCEQFIGLLEERHDRAGIARAASDVVLRVVGVDDRKAVMVLVCKGVDLVLYKVSAEANAGHTTTDTYLGKIFGRVQANCRGPVVELVTIEVKEMHQEVPNVMVWVHGSALYLGHQLKHAGDQAGDSEPSDTAIDRLVQAPHAEEMFDQCDQNRHDRELVSPGMERLDGLQARVILKGHINLEACPGVNPLDQRHFGKGDDLDLVLESKFLLLEGVTEPVHGPSSIVLGPIVSLVLIGAEYHVHVTGRQVKSGRERSEWINSGIREGVANKPVDFVEHLLTDTFLESTRLDIFVEIDDLFVQPTAHRGACRMIFGIPHPGAGVLVGNYSPLGLKLATHGRPGCLLEPSMRQHDLVVVGTLPATQSRRSGIIESETSLG